LAHTDDGFHEIQLNGKQLVFLFMAATVVSVVIFLCGVLVGRGVRAERGTEAEASLAAASEPTPQEITATPAPTPAGSDPTAAAAPPTVDELSYFDRLQTSNPPAEKLKAPDAKAAAPAPEKTAPVPRAAVPPPPKTAPAAKSAARPAAAPQGSGFAVQIAALNVRSEADAIAKRLTSKGYAAYVMSPAAGTPQIYRVRIGKFDSRREAESIAAKLEKEEQFKPWITR
jgi:cell division septation protein DedD